jgi:hypothetical protein
VIDGSAQTMHTLRMTKKPFARPLLGLGLMLGSLVAAAATPTGFTARYNVLKDGSPMGVATVTLRPGEQGQWVYSRDIKGTSGMAAMLGASVSETSHFRWSGDAPEAIRYDYELKAAIKDKQRHLSVDWARHQVTVDDGRAHLTYASTPGMVERNTTALAIGVALRDGKQQINLPVAVKQKVEQQSFKVTGRQTVRVPAGSFKTEQVERTDNDRGFDAWYAPDKYPVPVKVTQKDGGNLTMELVSYSAR